MECLANFSFINHFQCGESAKFVYVKNIVLLTICVVIWTEKKQSHFRGLQQPTTASSDQRHPSDLSAAEPESSSNLSEIKLEPASSKQEIVGLSKLVRASTSPEPQTSGLKLF